MFVKYEWQFLHSEDAHNFSSTKQTMTVAMALAKCLAPLPDQGRKLRNRESRNTAETFQMSIPPKKSPNEVTMVRHRRPGSDYYNIFWMT
jgi:hypothetical protein